MLEINKGSQEDFLQWLDTFEDDELIGRAGDISDCPLQHYLTYINPQLEVIIAKDICFWNYTKPLEENVKPVEEWQRVVVDTADRLRGLITKKQFLKAY
jgi:hypothetical protein